MSIDCASLPRPPSAAPAPPSSFRGQFGNPTGWLGWVVGQAMAVKNASRSRFVLEQLDVSPAHDVLEIGFGPGADLARLSDRARSLSGVDHSASMVRMASRRVKRADLRIGSACALPFADASFDRVLSINSVQFWESLPLGLCEVRRVLKPGGLAVIAIQPRNIGATAQTTAEWGERLEQTFGAVGFDSIRRTLSTEAPVPTVAVAAHRP
jgi:ubiquinone/menaquinone biosynthesis C-methylase UbiE